MRLVFMGTPDFAVKPFIAIADRTDIEIVGVITNKDKPFGRKMIITPCPVKAEALSRGYKVFSYDKIRIEGVEDVKSLAPDIIVTCAFGQILSQEILDVPKYGVINVHASLLPKYRGASPIHYAILNGEKKTGITIMKTDAGIDSGDILFERETEIGENETCGELFERLSVMGADAIVDALSLISQGKATFSPQDEEKATFTKMIKKEYALINWNLSAEQVKNQVRAFNPAPLSYSFYHGDQIKVFAVSVADGKGKAGEVLSSDKVLEIACGERSVIIEKLQKAGGKPMSAADFLRGNKIVKGELFSDA